MNVDSPMKSDTDKQSTVALDLCILTVYVCYAVHACASIFQSWASYLPEAQGALYILWCDCAFEHNFNVYSYEFQYAYLWAPG